MPILNVLNNVSVNHQKRHWFNFSSIKAGGGGGGGEVRGGSDQLKSQENG